MIYFSLMVKQAACVNLARISHWNQPVLSNENKVPCSMKQRDLLMGFKLTTDQLRVLGFTHSTSPLHILIPTHSFEEVFLPNPKCSANQTYCVPMWRFNAHPLEIRMAQCM